MKKSERKETAIAYEKFIITDHKASINNNEHLNNERFAFLDILRFCAAFIVSFAHLAKPEVIKNFPIFIGGGSGVIIFFFISGYIMPHAISRSRNIKKFLVKRCLRLFPLLIFTAIFCLIKYNIYEIKIENIILLILGLMLPIADFIKTPYVVKGVDWSLRLEFIFYILIVIIYFKNTFNFKTIIFCLILLSNFTIINYLHYGKYFDYRFILINFILLGSLLYLIEKENFVNFKNNFITFLAFIFSISISSLFKIFDSNFLFGSIFASMIFMILYIIHQTKFKIKSNKFIIFLGDISYPSYLLHSIIYLDLYTLTNSHIASSIIFVAICFGANLLIEKPIINGLKKYSN